MRLSEGVRLKPCVEVVVVAEPDEEPLPLLPKEAVESAGESGGFERCGSVIRLWLLGAV